MSEKTGLHTLLSTPILGGFLTFILSLAVPATICLLLGYMTQDQDAFFHYVFPPFMAIWNIFLQWKLKVIAITPLIPIPFAVLGIIRTIYVVFQYITNT